MRDLDDPRWAAEAYGDRPWPNTVDTLVYRMLEIGLEFVRDGAMLRTSAPVVHDAARMSNRAFALTL